MKQEKPSISPLEAKIAEWAKGQPDVRAALLIGSRATPQGARDGYSDHDVILFLDPASRLHRKDDWLEAFGRPLIVLREVTEHRGETVPTRLVQYRGGHRIDFTLSRVDLLHRIAEQEALPDWLAAGYRVLLDRDGDAAALRPPSASAYVPRPPTTREYRALVDEFWWETLYVGKYVSRNELLPARYSLETVLRYECLVPMLEWYVQIPREWEQSVGVRGRGLRWLLDLEDRELLDATYAADTLASHRRALDAMIELFRRAARAVARDLGLHYPAILDDETVRLLRGHREGGGAQPGT
ncbi:MAG: aminoglycoside 6-adenylyltransferase [Longimicrobiales bacterium]|nr:aminoglycoside 6-adenylyltransferase [Longimicrobiales bacterium]